METNVTSNMYLTLPWGLFFFWAILAPMTNFSDIKSDLTYYRGYESYQIFIVCFNVALFNVHEIRLNCISSSVY